MSLPVSPCSSPLRQLKQSNWSCLASPSHLAFSSGSAAHNPVSYMQNQMRGSDPVPDPWRDISQRPQSPYGSPKRFWLWSVFCRAVGDYQLSIFFTAKLGDPGDVCVDKSLVTGNPDCSWSDLLCRWKRCSWWLSTMCRCCKWSLYTLYILNTTIPMILYVK